MPDMVASVLSKFMVGDYSRSAESDGRDAELFGASRGLATGMKIAAPLSSGHPSHFSVSNCAAIRRGDSLCRLTATFVLIESR